MILPAFTLPDWPWGGDTVTARLYSNVDWTDVNGVRRLRGTPGALDFFQQFAGIVVNRSILFADGINTPATLSGLDRTDARVTMVLFDENGSERKTVFKDWQTSDALNPNTFAGLTIFNKRRCRALRDDHYLSAALVYAAIQAAIAGIVLVNMPVAVGLAAMVDGVVVVAEPLVTTFSRISAVSQDIGVTGNLRAPMGPEDDATENRIPGVSFTIRSSNIGDNGYVAWTMLEP